MSALTALLVFLISFALVAVLFRMPVSFALGTSSLLVLAYAGFQLVTVPQFAFSGLDSFALLAIPFYIFAGVIMEYSGISKMLIDWVKSFVGRVRGAAGIIRPVPVWLWRSYWLSYGHHQRHWKNDGA